MLKSDIQLMSDILSVTALVTIICQSTLDLLTSFELHSWQLHKEQLLLSLLLVNRLHSVLLLFPVKVELLVQETLSDLLHLLAVPVLLSHPFQNGQGLSQLGPTVPRVAVLG